jgi:hypothetical protein
MEEEKNLKKNQPLNLWVERGITIIFFFENIVQKIKLKSYSKLRYNNQKLYIYIYIFFYLFYFIYLFFLLGIIF